MANTRTARVNSKNNFDVFEVELQNNSTLPNHADILDKDYYSREDLEIYLYEEHKYAFGRKGYHYNFEKMSYEDLCQAVEFLSEACREETARLEGRVE